MAPPLLFRDCRELGNNDEARTAFGALEMVRSPGSLHSTILVPIPNPDDTLPGADRAWLRRYAGGRYVLRRLFAAQQRAEDP